MANEVLIKNGTPVVWADTTDYSSTVSGLTRTAQIDLTSVASVAARQGAKVDLGATRAKQYNVLVAIEFAVAPASGAVVEFYFGSSPSATAGNANPASITGADAAYTGTAGDSLVDSLKQLEFVGNLVATSDATTVVQYQKLVGVLKNPNRYISPVVYNATGQALVADAVEMYIALIPIVDEVQ